MSRKYRDSKRNFSNYQNSTFQSAALSPEMKSWEMESGKTNMVYTVDVYIEYI